MTIQCGDRAGRDMSSVYVVKDGGKSESMKPVHCNGEAKELQTILKNNFHLLRGSVGPLRAILSERRKPRKRETQTSGLQCSKKRMGI
jgi:hypothetical protein